MAQSDIGQQLPATLLEVMADSHFLFLGYSMRDWNLRVILRRIWGQRRLAYRSWAVQMPLADERQNRIEQRLWSDRRDIELLQCDLDGYVARLGERPGVGGRARYSQTGSRWPAGGPRESLRRPRAVLGGRRRLLLRPRPRDAPDHTANLRSSRLTLVYGASGVGKSSVLRAGVVRGLHERQGVAARRRGQGDAARIVPFSVATFSAWRDGSPLSGLMEAIRLATEAGDRRKSWRRGPPGPRRSRRCDRWAADVGAVLVVLDQFEEYFLYNPAEDLDDEQTFGGALPQILEDPSTSR